MEDRGKATAGQATCSGSIRQLLPATGVADGNTAFYSSLKQEGPDGLLNQKFLLTLAITVRGQPGCPVTELTDAESSNILT